jgi:hypothetical protein
MRDPVERGVRIVRLPNAEKLDRKHHRVASLCGSNASNFVPCQSLGQMELFDHDSEVSLSISLALAALRP